jgi:RNase P subunit RPR2
MKGGEVSMMYCVKCRAKREGKDAQDVTMKNGKKATKAVCEVCGTTMFKIGGK